MRLSKNEEERLADRERTYWWHVAKRIYLGAILRRHSIPKSSPFLILDVGGAGGETQELFDESDRLVVVEPAMTSPLLHSRAKLRVVARGENLPFRKNQFDLVIAADVIEHVAEDFVMAEEVRRVTKPECYCLVTVPAFPSLFSSHDEALGHFRRYTRKTLRELFARTKWGIQYETAIFIALLPGIFLRRWLSPPRSKRPESSYVDVPKWVNTLLIAWCVLEAGWIHIGRWPFGCSRALLAKKPNS